MSDDDDRTASLMTPAKLAQLKVRPAATSPSAWLDQLAADAGSGHVRRLLDLRRQLQTQFGEPQYAAAAQASSGFAQALDAVDFSLLQPKGWLARATGKGKEAAAAFRAQADRCSGAADALARELRALQGRHQPQVQAIERTLVECEVEVRAIEKIMDQGARWLQDMRTQLKAREAAGGDAATLQKIQEDARRCELLVARLKLLRTANSAALQAVDHCKAVAPRRAALAASLQQVLEAGWKNTSRELDTLGDQALAGAAPDGLERTRQELPRLREALQQAAEEAGALQQQEQALAGALAALQEPLQAAG